MKLFTRQKQIKLIKETRLRGEVIYYTTINNNYVSNSLSIKLDEATDIYTEICRRGNGNPTIETLIETIQ